MLSVDTTAFVLLAIVFTLVFVLKNNFFEPLAKASETRQAGVERAANAWADAQRTIEEAQGSLDDAVQQMRNAGYEQLDRSRGEAQKRARTKLDLSREAAQQQVAEAKKELRAETDEAIKSLQVQADGFARSLASRILGRNVA